MTETFRADHCVDPPTVTESVKKALDYGVKYAKDHDVPVVYNMSFGNLIRQYHFESKCMFWISTYTRIYFVVTYNNTIYFIIIRTAPIL